MANNKLPMSLGLAALAGSPVLFSGTASACAACAIANNDKIQKVLLFSTSLLSLVPLILIGGIGYYIYRRFHSEDIS
ncbi:MAG: hypothetical protein WCO71_08835 [Pseudomonadota bacterium]